LYYLAEKEPAARFQAVNIARNSVATGIVQTQQLHDKAFTRPMANRRGVDPELERLEVMLERFPAAI